MLEQENNIISKEVAASEKYKALHNSYLYGSIAFICSMLAVAPAPISYFAVLFSCSALAYLWVLSNKEMIYLEEKYAVPCKRFSFMQKKK